MAQNTKKAKKISRNLYDPTIGSGGFLKNLMKKIKDNYEYKN